MMRTKMPIAAVRELVLHSNESCSIKRMATSSVLVSPIGTSRHFVALRCAAEFGRCPNEADIEQAAPIKRDL
jgi:hypothetical protein